MSSLARTPAKYVRTACKRGLTRREHTKTTSVFGLEDLNIELAATTNNAIGTVLRASTQVRTLVNLVRAEFEDLVSEKTLACTSGVISILEVGIDDVVRIQVGQTLAFLRAGGILLAIATTAETLLGQTLLNILA